MAAARDIFTKVTKMALELTQYSLHRIPWTSSPGDKVAGAWWLPLTPPVFYGRSYA